MKVTVIILGILGALASFALGAKWLSDYNKYKGTVESVQALSQQLGGVQGVDQGVGELNQVVKAAYALIGGAALAFLVSIFVPMLGKSSSILYAASGIVPGILDTRAFLGSGLLILVALLALLVKKKSNTPALK